MSMSEPNIHGSQGVMFSQTAEYALRAVVVMGNDPKRCWKRDELAKATKVPADYLSKVLQALGRKKIVLSQRGIGGGFVLTREPAKISILEVVSAVDPIARIRSCPLGLKSHGKNLCSLHRKLDKTLADAESAFASTSLSDILSEAAPTRIRPCDFPAQPISRGK